MNGKSTVSRLLGWITTLAILVQTGPVPGQTSPGQTVPTRPRPTRASDPPSKGGVKARKAPGNRTSRIRGLSPEAERAAKALALSKDFEAGLFASEPLLSNPVAFCVDETGTVLVCETFRLNRGVEDNREHRDWIDDDLAAKTVDDRLAFFKKHLQDDIEKYAVQQDRIRIIQDRNGDGRADRASVFIDGFDDVLEGPGAGILSWRGTVYYACVPRLWAFRDDDGDGKVDKRKSTVRWVWRSCRFSRTRLAWAES